MRGDTADDPFLATLNGLRLTPRLVSATFPKIEDMKEGLGDIHLEFAVDQVNCASSRDPAITPVAQQRNETQ